MGGMELGPPEPVCLIRGAKAQEKVNWLDANREPSHFGVAIQFPQASHLQGRYDTSGFCMN